LLLLLLLCTEEVDLDAMMPLLLLLFTSAVSLDSILFTMELLLMDFPREEEEVMTEVLEDLSNAEVTELAEVTEEAA
jgi:hypothetical protein